MDEATRNDLIRMVRKVEQGLPIKHRISQHRTVNQAMAETAKEKRRKAHDAIGAVTGRDTTKVTYTFDPQRVQAVSSVRLHAIPGFDRTVFRRDVVELSAIDAAIGTGMGTVRSWLRQGRFPPPLGHWLKRFRKVPAYTVTEVLAYLRLVVDETGGQPTSKIWSTAPDLQKSLFAARDRLAETIDRGEKERWRLKHETARVTTLPFPSSSSAGSASDPTATTDRTGST